jgi:hypothetical protein
MTADREDGTLTVLDLLFGAEADVDAVRALAGEITSPGSNQAFDRALAGLPEATRKAAVQEAATAAAALLKVDLIDVLARGWREHRDIVAAARRTLTDPGSTELVSMSGHEVTLEQHPSVRVLVDGRQIATVQLGLSIVFVVTALLLGVSGGKITAVRAGNCDITVTLAVQSTELISRRTHLELPGVMSLRRGLRLLPSAEYSATETSPAE